MATSTWRAASWSGARPEPGSPVRVEPPHPKWGMRIGAALGTFLQGLRTGLATRGHLRPNPPQAANVSRCREAAGCRGGFSAVETRVMLLAPALRPGRLNAVVGLLAPQGGLAGAAGRSLCWGHPPAVQPPRADGKPWDRQQKGGLLPAHPPTAACLYSQGISLPCRVGSADTWLNIQRVC